MMLRVHAYLQSGRMIASAYSERKKGRIIIRWCDTRDTGGVYGTLEEWMRVVNLEHSGESVSFRYEETS